MAEELTQFEFEEEFEQKLLAHLVRDIKFYLRNKFVMKSSYFVSKIRGDIYTRASQYMEKYKEAISLEALRNEITAMYIAKKKKDVPIDMYWDILTDMYARDLSGGGYAEDKVMYFARGQEMASVLKDGAKRIMGGKDLRPILTGAIKALAIGNKLELGYNYFENIIQRTSMGYEKPERTVSTGYKKLDKFLGGGLGSGEIGVIVGPSSRGKTASLVNIALGALTKKRSVLYIVLEGKVEDIAVRFDLLLSRTSKDFLHKEAEKVRDHLLYVSQLLKTKLIIKGFPTETVTVDDIDQYITHEEIITELKPDLLIIDSLNLCKKSNPKEDTWLGTNYREGKAMCIKRNLPLWTASQAKDDSLKGEIVEPKHIAEATIRIWSDSDVVIGLCQTDVEAKEDPAKLRWYLGKNRNREAKKSMPMIFNKSIMFIEEDPT
jgi:hypothetical protein